MKSINARLPEGLQIIACGLKSDMDKKKQVDESFFSVDLRHVDIDTGQLALFHSKEEWPYTRKSRKGSIHRIDLKTAVKQVYLGGDHTLFLAIRTDLAHTVRPADLLIGVFNFSPEQLQGVRILKRMAAAP